MPVVRLDPAEGSVSSRVSYERATSCNVYTHGGRYVHTVHADRPAILFNYWDRSSATDAVKRRLVDFLGREDVGAPSRCFPRPRPRPRRRVVVLVDGRTACEQKERDFDIYSAVRRETRKNTRRFAILK